MASKRNSEEIIKFLDKYERYENLWNIRHPDYSNKTKRGRSMIKLLNEVSNDNIAITNLDGLRKKIKIIKNVYRQELLKVEKSKRTAARAEDIYKPKLLWYKRADSFLRNIISARPRTANPAFSTAEREQHEQPQQEVAIKEEDSETAAKKRKLSPRRIPARSTKSHEDNTVNADDLPVANLQNLSQRRQSDDEYDIFGKHIAAQLRQLPSRSFVILQEKIQRLITSERLSCIDDSAATSYAAPPTFKEGNPSSAADSFEIESTSEENFSYAQPY